ncbi:Structural maintenance of chromosomes protein 2 [Marasmius crinis-equi]|uniref:Structural maintenance of chromosomes protein 2 n=1 Tax=Marasmius crinis-equi TaxID=585013 RepID=A0ABR3FZ92_9AGAR
MGQLQAARSRRTQASAEEKQLKNKVKMTQKELRDVEVQWKKVEKDAGEGKKRLEMMQGVVNERRRKVGACGWTEEMEKEGEAKLDGLNNEVERLTARRDQVHRTLGNMDFDYQMPGPHFDQRKVKGRLGTLVSLKPENYEFANALEVTAGSKLHQVVVADETVSIQAQILKFQFYVLAMSLPTEFWHGIAKRLLRNDLIRLSSTNSKGLPGSADRRTFPSLINLDAMKNLTGLQKLEIANDVFDSNIPEATKTTFFEIRVVDNQSIGITQCESSPGRDRFLKLTPHGFSKLDPYPGSTIDTVSNEVQTRLFELRLPSLRSLTLRDRIATGAGNPPSLGRGFTELIVAHNNITYLDFGYTSTRSSSLNFTDQGLDTFRAKPSLTLPRLESFCGDTSSFRILTQARLSCLSSALTKVDVGQSGTNTSVFELSGQMAPMFDAGQYLISNQGRFGALREFGLYLGDFKGVLGLGVSISVFVNLAGRLMCLSGEENRIEVWKRPFPFIDIRRGERALDSRLGC